jgi:hypothetical protein
MSTQPKPHTEQIALLIQRPVIIIKQTLMWNTHTISRHNLRHLTGATLLTTPQTFATLDAGQRRVIAHETTAAFTLSHFVPISNRSVAM